MEKSLLPSDIDSEIILLKTLLMESDSEFHQVSLKAQISNLESAKQE